MRFSRLDFLVWSIAGLLILLTLLVAVRGDQVGVAIEASSPVANSQAAASAPIVIQFSQKMDVSSVQSHFEIQPAVAGNFVWRENTLYFLPTTAFETGENYEVRLTAGAKSQLGHVLREDLVWNFGIRQPGVAFLRRGANGYEVWVLPDLSSQPQQLSNTNGGVFDYTVMADGENVIFSAVNDQKGIDLWKIPRLGGEATKLLDCGADRCFGADSSTDGRIAYSRSQAPLTPADPYSPPRIWLFDPQTGQNARLYADTQKIGFDPSWSADAKHLAYYDGVQEQIVVVDLSNGNEISLPTLSGLVGSWTPDGKQMIFFDTKSDSTGTSNILFRADLETQDILPFFDPQPTDADFSFPVVSPDGAWVAMTVNLHEAAEAGDQIWVTPQDGLYASVVAQDPGFLYVDPSWDPWSSKLIYSSLQLGISNPKPEIWVWQMETGSPQLLVKDGSSPQWLP